MNRKIKSLFITVASLIGFIDGIAQDVHLTQFYASPLYLNPAFTGNIRENRFAMTYRNQWPGISKAFESQTFSFDHNADKLHSGFGLLMTNDKAGTMGYRSTYIGLSYAYQLILARNIGFNAGVNGGYGFHSIDKTKLIFNDQLYRQSSTSYEDLDQQYSSKYLDVGAGALVYGQTWWLGFSTVHLNKPNESLHGSDASIPIKYSLHGGAKTLSHKAAKKSDNSDMKVAFNYQGQEKFDQLDLGFYYTQNSFLIGGWYRGIPGVKSYKKGYQNNDAIMALVGYTIDSDKQNFRVGYSYDITLSRLSTNSAGSHEISLIYEFSRKKKRKRLLVPCPKF
jgi:type IX secretion system PorP/SprF family membrane protein